MDYNQNKILVYNLDLKYIKQIKEDKFYSNIAVSNGKIILYGNNYNPEGGNSFTVINEKTGKIDSSFMPYKDHNIRKYDLTMGFCFNKNDDNIILSKSFSDTIFTYENDLLKPYAVYDFGDKKLPYSSIHDIFVFDPSLSYLFKGNFFLNKNILLTNVFSQGKTIFNIYDFSTKTSFTGKIENDLNKIPLFPMWSSAGYLVQCVTTEIYGKFYPSENKDSQSNPYLLLYKFK